MEDLGIEQSFGGVFAAKRILVTGATGFKGSWLCSWLKKLGAHVHGFSLDIPTNPSLFEILRLEKQIAHTFGDIRALDTVERLIGEVKPEFVFHLAAQPLVRESYNRPIDTFTTNVIGTANLLEALRRSSLPCAAILITSDKCYDNVEWVWGYRENDRLAGKDPYSASKSCAEIVIRSFYLSYLSGDCSPLRVCAVRAGNVIGGGDWAADRIVPDCIRAWSAEQPVVVRNPNSTRPWQHVLEPLSGYLRTAQELHRTRAISGEAYNFGPAAEHNYSVGQLLEQLASHWPFRAAGERMRSAQGGTVHEAGLLKLNCDKALAQLGWSPVLTFEETARFTAAWYSEYCHNPAGDLWSTTLEQIDQYRTRAQEKGLVWAR